MKIILNISEELHERLTSREGTLIYTNEIRFVRSRDGGWDLHLVERDNDIWGNTRNRYAYHTMPTPGPVYENDAIPPPPMEYFPPRDEYRDREGNTITGVMAAAYDNHDHHVRANRTFVDMIREGITDPPADTPFWNATRRDAGGTLDDDALQLAADYLRENT